MKWALIHLGSDIAYGLMFFAGELLRKGHEIHWFDGDSNYKKDLVSFSPKFVCFGPLSSEFEQAIRIAKWVKNNTKAKTVFGGHHIRAVPGEKNNPFIDYPVFGPCYNVIDNIIINAPVNTLIIGSPVPPENMVPAGKEYFKDIPRIGKRHRKYMMSHFGCVFNCNFCTTCSVRKDYGPSQYKRYWLTRRPVDDLIAEAIVMKEAGTKEIGLNDDDGLYDTQSNGKGTEWLKEFADKWKEVDIPLYINVTPKTVLRATPKALQILATLVDTVQMGLETHDKGSKKLFNRQFQSEKQVIDACKILYRYGIKVKLEIIVGLPNINGLVPDPVEDALHTVQSCQRIAKIFPNGTIKAACNALVLYPGTKLWTLCKEHKVPTQEGWKFALYEGIGSVLFSYVQERRLRNIVKMTVMFIKYNMSEEWIRSLIDMEMTDSAREGFSKAQYLDSLTFRLGNGLKKEFINIVNDMTFKY